MKFYIPTCDKYINYIEAFRYSIRTFWKCDHEFIIVGYKQPNFDLEDWKFISLGEDRGPNYFGEDMLKFFSSVEDEVFGYLNDDILIINYVDDNLINIYYDLLKNDKNIGRICLTSDLSFRVEHETTIPGYFEIGYISDYQMIELKQNSNYRISTQCSMWNKSYLLKYLHNNLTPWQFELDQSVKAIGDGYRIIGCHNRTLLDISHLFRQGNFMSDWNIGINTRRHLEGETKNACYNIIIKHLNK